MLLSQQLFYLIIGAGVLFGLPALWLFCSAMWPRMTEKSRAVASRGLLVNLLIGLPVIALTLAFLATAGKRGQVGGLIAIGVGGLVFVWGIAGLTGLAQHIGHRLWSGCTGHEAWRALWRGGLVISGVLAIPFIGWYVLSAALLSIGLGIRVRMWFAKGAALEKPALEAATVASTPPVMIASPATAAAAVSAPLP